MSAPETTKPSFFARLGPWCHDHRRLVVLTWVVLLVVAGVSSGITGNAYRDEFRINGAESQAGIDLLEDRFGGFGSGITGTIVVEAPDVSADAVRAPMEELFRIVAAEDDVLRVVSPYSPEGAEQISRQGPAAGTIAYANVEFPSDIDIARVTEIRDDITEFLDSEAVTGVADLRVELGGFIFGEFETPSSELLGIAFAIVVLIIAFGSVLAMGLPVGTALFGIFIAVSATMVLSQVATIPELAQFLAVMIGLGVGIDYALLIVTRYREQLHAGHSVREAIGTAIDTAGRSVLFAGTTVVISMLGMVVMNVTFITGLGVGAALAVGLTVLASLTLLPAMLGYAGLRVEVTRRRGLIAAALFAVGLLLAGLKVGPIAVLPFLAAVVVLIAGLFVPGLKREVLHRTPKPRRETLAYRWSRIIQHRPWPAAIGGTLILLLLALPFLSLRLGASDESNFAEDTTTKQAYDLLVRGFGIGFNGPLIMAAALEPGTTAEALAPIQEAVSESPGVVFASPPTLNEQGDAASWVVVPDSGPQDEATVQLLDRLRDQVLPPAEQAAGVDVKVTGMVASNVDFSDYLAARLPVFFAAVLILSFLLLMVVFRSLLVPLKAVIMNLLSIGAAYGVVVALFQWGWLSDITGVEPAPIEPWAPMMLFAIVFGLSMDYEVFLLSRVREEWTRTHDSRNSVADGLAATAKVITAAAAIMVVVFGAFVLENDRALKLMGTGLATAIFLDATVVRMLLVPATMELLGDKNWWLPRWLDRILPNIDVEGHADHVDEHEDELATTGAR